MENIIVVEGRNKYSFNNVEEIIKFFLGEDFETLNEEQKYKKLRLRTLMNSTFRGLPAKDLIKGENIDNIEDNQYIIYDEQTFLLSLAKNNDLAIYENENAEQLAKGIDKTNLERISKNYIRINDCATDILKKKIQNLNLKKYVTKENENEKGERM